MMRRVRRPNGWGWSGNEADRILSAILPETGQWAWEREMVHPALNLAEDAKNVYVEAMLPGLKIEDIELSVLGNELTLSGEHKGVENEEGSYSRRERPRGTFTRTVRLPDMVDAEKVNAVLEHGILKVTLPRKVAAKPRRIEVKPAQ